MIARCATQVVAGLRGQEVQRSKRQILPQPIWDGALQAVCGVRLGTHARYARFLDYGDAPDYEAKLEEFRIALGKMK